MQRVLKLAFLVFLFPSVMSNNGFSKNNTTDCGTRNHQHNIPMDRNAQIAVPIVFGLILLFGIVGNGSVIVIVWKNKQMRTIPNIYLVSLALGDLLLVLCAVPFSAFVFTFPSWMFGDGLCKVNFFLETLSLGVSVFTLTLLSIDRYLAISHPMRKMSARSTKNTVCRASAVWIISLCLAIPDGISSGVRLNPMFCVSFCDPYKPDWGLWYVKFHVIQRFIVFFAVPVVIISICYCLMAKTLVSSSSHVLADISSKSNGSSKTKAGRTQVAKLVLSFVVVFIACWLPRHVYLIGHNFDLFNFTFGWYVFKIVGFCLAFINSCMNPMALYLQSEQFRKHFCLYFCHCFPYRIPQAESHSIPSTVISHCHYTKGSNEDSSNVLIKFYKD